MKFYFLIKGTAVIGAGQCPCESEGTICIEVTEEQYNLLQEKGNNYYIYQDNEIVLNPEYNTTKLQEVKAEKYQENDIKAEEARTNKTFVLTLQDKECEFDTKAQTQTDLLTAFAVCSQGLTYDGWICNNGVEINLTLEDVVTISATFKQLSNVYPHWNYYKNLIDNATTIEEVKAIVIDYTVNLGE